MKAWIDARISRLPSAQRPAARSGVAFACVCGGLLAGFFAAVVVHYIFYRVGLPSRPFIYVAF